MLLHIVLFNFKKGFSWASQESADAELSTKNHPKQIDQIQGWLCSRNVSDRKLAADFMVLGLFNNISDVQDYLIHPNHQEGVEKWRKIANWQVIDIDMNDETTHTAELMDSFKSLVIKKS
ncbi:Dabb family protein [Thalassotalea euphylliae]|uniref:Dabb family protein n=1 Tax=Thalassotalea euphylliae TaxID=1655234 RepID=A0A3E0U3L0_9GAMM|nr:Dabb family protein [Thalassotalea euphylliae]REL31304.1 Dabb family protein [Thalassotalea euphylliae]